eukprot:351025-Chlamydomonas_euryale.AAC.5
MARSAPTHQQASPSTSAGGSGAGGSSLALKAAIVAVALFMRVAIAYVSDYSGGLHWVPTARS